MVSRYRKEFYLAFGIIYTDPKKKPNSKKNQKSKDQTAAQQKPIGLSELELFVASGLDLPQTSNLNVSKVHV